MNIRRIVIGLDVSPQARGALDTAASLAHRMEAELVGLFVEREELIRLAGLPFACEVCLPSAQTRGIDLKRMERSLRAMAEESRRLLAAAARRQTPPLRGHSGAPPLRWSFQVTRTAPGQTLSGPGDPSDLLVLARSLGTSSNAPSAATRSPVLLLQRELALPAPALLICTPEDKAQRLATTLATFSPLIGDTLSLMVLEEDARTAQSWLHAGLPAFGECGLTVTRTRIESPRNTAAVMHAVDASDPGMVIFADGRPGHAALRTLLEASRRPLLLLPSGSDA